MLLLVCRVQPPPSPASSLLRCLHSSAPSFPPSPPPPASIPASRRLPPHRAAALRTRPPNRFPLGPAGQLVGGDRSEVNSRIAADRRLG